MLLRCAQALGFFRSVYCYWLFIIFLVPSIARTEPSKIFEDIDAAHVFYKREVPNIKTKIGELALKSYLSSVSNYERKRIGNTEFTLNKKRTTLAEALNQKTPEGNALFTLGEIQEALSEELYYQAVMNGRNEHLIEKQWKSEEGKTYRIQATNLENPYAEPNSPDKREEIYRIITPENICVLVLPDLSWVETRHGKQYVARIITKSNKGRGRNVLAVAGVGTTAFEFKVFFRNELDPVGFSNHLRNAYLRYQRYWWDANYVPPTWKYFWTTVKWSTPLQLLCFLPPDYFLFVTGQKATPSYEILAMTTIFSIVIGTYRQFYGNITENLDPSSFKQSLWAFTKRAVLSSLLFQAGKDAIKYLVFNPDLDEPHLWLPQKEHGTDWGDVVVKDGDRLMNAYVNAAVKGGFSLPIDIARETGAVRGKMVKVGIGKYSYSIRAIDFYNDLLFQIPNVLKNLDMVLDKSSPSYYVIKSIFWSSLVWAPKASLWFVSKIMRVPDERLEKIRRSQVDQRIKKAFLDLFKKIENSGHRIKKFETQAIQQGSTEALRQLLDEVLPTTEEIKSGLRVHDCNEALSTKRYLESLSS